MSSVSLFLAAVLVAIAIFHFLWGIKIWFPLRKENSLARAVVGFKGIQKMPSPLACLTVSFALLILALIALVSGGVILPGFVPVWLMESVCFIAGFIFLFRGVAGYLPVFANLTPEQPFRTYDVLFYSPLCLMLGGGFLYLAWSYMAAL